MSVIMEQVMPEGVSLQMLDEVTDEMNADQDPPEGMLVHLHFEQDGSIRIVDVWDSQEAYETFRDSRLVPAIQAVMERHGGDEPAQAEEVFTSVHRVVRGR